MIGWNEGRREERKTEVCGKGRRKSRTLNISIFATEMFNVSQPRRTVNVARTELCIEKNVLLPSLTIPFIVLSRDISALTAGLVSLTVVGI